MDLSKIREKATRFAVGLTCGNSCVGIDAVLVRIKGSGPKAHIKLVDGKHFPHSSGLRTRLLVARKEAHELGLLNIQIGHRLAEAAYEMVRTASTHLCEVDFIAMEGATVAHSPQRGPDSDVGSLTIGDSTVVAEKTDLPVVSDFRVRDMAAQGQGGPILAYADHVLFAREGRTVARLHLGGFVTMTVLPPALEQTVGFDVGPGNVAIDAAVRQLTTGTRYLDKNGKAAASGVVIDEFLEYLLDQQYLNRVPPKTTWRDDFGPEVYLRDALAGRRDTPFEDLMATVTAAVGTSIVRAYNRFVKPQYDVDRIVVSGGGARNKALMDHLTKGLPDTVIRVSDEYGIPCDSLDACGVAILGNETIFGKSANIPQTTGALHPVVLGKITPV
jgi:anhydro-N-acetylmuramic acid kinase